MELQDQAKKIPDSYVRLTKKRRNKPEKLFLSQIRAQTLKTSGRNVYLSRRFPAWGGWRQDEKWDAGRATPNIQTSTTFVPCKPFLVHVVQTKLIMCTLVWTLLNNTKTTNPFFQHLLLWWFQTLMARLPNLKHFLEIVSLVAMYLTPPSFH